MKSRIGARTNDNNPGQEPAAREGKSDGENLDDDTDDKNLWRWYPKFFSWHAIKDEGGKSTQLKPYIHRQRQNHRKVVTQSHGSKVGSTMIARLPVSWGSHLPS